MIFDAAEFVYGVVKRRKCVKKIKKCIAENWKDYIAIILMSISVVCVLLDIVQVFNISYFYSPYILVAPLSLAVVLKMFCIQEGRKSRGFPGGDRDDRTGCFRNAADFFGAH